MPPNSYDVNFPKKSENKQPKEKKISVTGDEATSSDCAVHEAVPFEEALKEIGFGKVQVQLICLIILILVTVINETMGVSFLIPAAQCDLNLSLTDKGLLSGMAYFGIMVASYFMGFLGDTQGRKRVMLISLLFSTLFTWTSVFINNFTLFVICRFFTGVFVSGYSATVYAYIGEFNSNANRAAIISWVSVAIGLATTFMPLTALWILSYDWRFELYDGYEFRPWRLLLLIYTLPGVVGGLCLFFKFPESPKYMLSQNQTEEAMEIARWMYRTNKGKRNHDDMKVQRLQSEASELSGKTYEGLKAIMMSLGSQTLPLFKPPYVLYFASCSLLHFGTFCVAGGLAMFLPEILNRLSKERQAQSSDGLKICDVMQMGSGVIASNDSIAGEYVCDDSVESSVFVDSAYLGIGYIIGFVALSLLIKPLGRRTIFIFTLLTAGISGVLLPFVTSHIVIIMLYCFLIICSGLNVSVINGAACDLFPTHLRAMAVCVSMLFGRAASVLSTNLIGYMMEQHCEMTYYILSGIVFLCFAVSFIIPS